MFAGETPMSQLRSESKYNIDCHLRAVAFAASDLVAVPLFANESAWNGQQARRILLMWWVCGGSLGSGVNPHYAGTL